MFRLISIILLLAGLGALIFGGSQFLKSDPVVAAPVEAAVVEPSLEVAEPQPSLSKVEMAPSSSFDKAEETVDVATATGDVMETLRSVPIAHETPSKAKFGRPFEVTVAVDGTGDDTAADALPGRGNIVEGVAQISASVQATLSGEMFDIEPITPTVQRISPLTENVWRWKVTPTQTGSQDLVIELFALAGQEALPVRTFRDRVEVQVSRVGQAIAIANSVSPVAMVLGGFGSLLAGLFGVARFFRGR
ncbi:MAG: hypothetical protein P8H62_09125 [Henriciella sp.]|nr:hypothetical protein [Henriciella sp.]